MRGDMKSESAEVFGVMSNVCLAGADGLPSSSSTRRSIHRRRSIHMDARAGKVTSVYRDKLRVMDCADISRPAAAFLPLSNPLGASTPRPIPEGQDLFEHQSDRLDGDGRRLQGEARSLIHGRAGRGALWVATEHGNDSALLLNERRGESQEQISVACFITHLPRTLSCNALKQTRYFLLKRSKHCVFSLD